VLKPSPLLRRVIEAAAEDEASVSALALADVECIELLVRSGAVPRFDEATDDFSRSVENVGQAFGLEKARETMFMWLREKGLDRVFADEPDFLVDLESSTQHAAYILGLTVGLRLAGG